MSAVERCRVGEITFDDRAPLFRVITQLLADRLRGLAVDASDERVLVALVGLGAQRRQRVDKLLVLTARLPRRTRPGLLRRRRRVLLLLCLLLCLLLLASKGLRRAFEGASCSARFRQVV